MESYKSQQITKEILENHIGEQLQRLYEVEHSLSELKRRLSTLTLEERNSLWVDIDGLKARREQIIQICTEYGIDSEQLVFLFANFVDFKVTGEILDESLQ